MRKKISIIGAGNVGATVAHICALKQLGNIVLADIVKGLPQGKALDIYQSSPIEGFDLDIKGTNNYEDTKNSDIVVITAGVARKPGISRDDLLSINTKIMKSVSEQVAKYSPDSILIIVSNPLDAMVYVAAEVTKFRKSRVIGMAGILDTARFRSFIASELNVSVTDINAFVLGGHGDSMVPLVRYTNVAGTPITELLSKEKINKIIERTRQAGAEIVNLLQTGSAYYAPAASVVEMIESIIKDKKKILPCAAYLDSHYGVKGLFIGVPVKLGKDGVEEIIEIKLNKQEIELFEKTVQHVKELAEQTRSLL